MITYGGSEFDEKDFLLFGENYGPQFQQMKVVVLVVEGVGLC